MSLQNPKFITVKAGIGFVALTTILACNFLSPLTSSPGTGPMSTPTDQPTLVPTPTEVQLFTEIFSLENASDIPPEDVLAEVYYDTSGGPDGYGGDCYNIQSEFPVAAPDNQKVVEREEELLRPVQLIVCDWEEQEQVVLRTTLPDGTSTESTLVAQRDLSSFYSAGIRTKYIYFPPINSVEGKYEFVFTGKSGTVQFTINYVSPTAPIAYVIDTKELNKIKQYTFSNIDLPSANDLPLLSLSGYIPNEKVRLFIYYGSGFRAWKEYQVNDHGRLAIQMKDYGNVVVIGNESFGEIHPPVYPAVFIQYVDRLDPIFLTCKDTIPTRLKVGDYAFVLPVKKSNELHSEPTLSAAWTDNLAPDTVVELIGGPECADGILWWQVKGVDRTFEGWTGEGDTEYWLYPCYVKEQCR